MNVYTNMSEHWATTALGTGDGTSPNWSLLIRHLRRTHVGFGCNEIGQSFGNSDPQTSFVRLCERYCTLTILVTRVLRFSQRSIWESPSLAIRRASLDERFPTFQRNVMSFLLRVKQPKKTADFSRSQQLRRSQKAHTVNALCQFQNRQRSIAAILTTLTHDASTLSPTKRRTAASYPVNAPCGPSGKLRLPPRMWLKFIYTIAQWQEIREDWRKRHRQELHDLYSSQLLGL